jgi:hypothetical protein
MQTMFDSSIEENDGVLVGPIRKPLQMLSAQDYAGHASMHDDAAARSVGFRGGAIEGPTHFSQFVPLCVAIWGDEWLAKGCLSAHYRSASYEGDELRAYLRRPASDRSVAEIWMERSDGTEILRGTASVGPQSGETALEARLAKLEPLSQPVILSEVKTGTRVPSVPVVMALNREMASLYPFTLADKLKVITEPSQLYISSDNQWGRQIIPFEMISVLMQYTWDETTVGVKGPALGLFADQEIRLVGGPVFVDEEYELDREVTFMSGSRRTESVWIRSRLLRPRTHQVIAVMLLNCAILKESYPPYEAERKTLYGA